MNTTLDTAAIDRSYLKNLKWFHRFVLRLFTRILIRTFGSLLNDAYERQIIDSKQLHLLSDMTSARLRPAWDKKHPFSAQVIGKLCITWTNQGHGAPLVDSCSTHDKEGNVYKGVAILLTPWRRDKYGASEIQPALVLAWKVEHRPQSSPECLQPEDSI